MRLPSAAKNHGAPRWLLAIPGTPLGPLLLAFTSGGLAALEFAGAEARPGSEGDIAIGPANPGPPFLAPLIAAARRELARYFAAIPTDFCTLNLDLRGTPFQLQVWRQLGTVPWGATVSYQELARRLGNPRASRAVGQALGANPIPIIIPCHRVIAADGSLGGYSSGLPRKRWLLQHEGAR